MANHRGGWATSQRILFVVSAAAAVLLSCGGAAPAPAAAETTGVAAPLTAADASNAGRAGYYVAEVARYRDIANRERQLSAAYARWTPPAGAGVTKDWNATLKARADARAVAADQIATRTQTFADFFAAEAAKEAGR